MDFFSLLTIFFCFIPVSNFNFFTNFSGILKTLNFSLNKKQKLVVFIGICQNHKYTNTRFFFINCIIYLTRHSLIARIDKLNTHTRIHIDHKFQFFSIFLTMWFICIWRCSCVVKARNFWNLIKKRNFSINFFLPRNFYKPIFNKKRKIIATRYCLYFFLLSNSRHTQKTKINWNSK